MIKTGLLVFDQEHFSGGLVLARSQLVEVHTFCLILAVELKHHQLERCLGNHHDALGVAAVLELVEHVGATRALVDAHQRGGLELEHAVAAEQHFAQAALHHRADLGERIVRRRRRRARPGPDAHQRVAVGAAPPAGQARAAHPERAG